MFLQRFDLFQLHSWKEDKKPRSWIRFEGKNLCRILREIINEILAKKGQTKRKFSITLAALLNYKSYSRLNSYIYNLFNQDIPLPIPVIMKTLDIYRNVCNLNDEKIDNTKQKILENIEYLSMNVGGGNRTKSVKELTISLAKIIGAHLADGNLLIKKNSVKWNSYRFLLEEENEISVKKLGKLFEDVFGIQVESKYNNKNNTWKIELWNKIILRYFTKILKIPHGNKTYIAEEPTIIKHSSRNIREAFATGVLTFDGSIGIDFTQDLFVRSKKLAESIYDILKKDNLNVKIKKKGEFYSVRGIIENKKWLKYFEVGSSKWLKVKFCLNLLKKCNIYSFPVAVEKLNKLFPRSKIKEVINQSREMKNFKANDLTKKLKMKRRTTSTYIKLLCRLKILTREGFFYSFNSDTSCWMLPE